MKNRFLKNYNDNAPKKMKKNTATNVKQLVLTIISLPKHFSKSQILFLTG
jgi:hypothetical protein